MIPKAKSSSLQGPPPKPMTNSPPSAATSTTTRLSSGMSSGKSSETSGERFSSAAVTVLSSADASHSLSSHWWSYFWPTFQRRSSLEPSTHGTRRPMDSQQKLPSPPGMYTSASPPSHSSRNGLSKSTGLRTRNPRLFDDKSDTESQSSPDEHNPP